MAEAATAANVIPPTATAAATGVATFPPSPKTFFPGGTQRTGRGGEARRRRLGGCPRWGGPWQRARCRRPRSHRPVGSYGRGTPRRRPRRRSNGGSRQTRPRCLQHPVSIIQFRGHNRHDRGLDRSPVHRALSLHRQEAGGRQCRVGRACVRSLDSVYGGGLHTGGSRDHNCGGSGDGRVGRPAAAFDWLCVGPPPSTWPSAAAAAAVAAVGPSRNRARLASSTVVHTDSISRYIAAWIAGAFRRAPRGQLGRHYRPRTGPQRAQRRPVAATRRKCRRRPSGVAAADAVSTAALPTLSGGEQHGRQTEQGGLSSVNFASSSQHLWLSPIQVVDAVIRSAHDVPSSRRKTATHARIRSQRAWWCALFLLPQRPPLLASATTPAKAVHRTSHPHYPLSKMEGVTAPSAAEGPPTVRHQYHTLRAAHVPTTLARHASMQTYMAHMVGFTVGRCCFFQTNDMVYPIYSHR